MDVFALTMRLQEEGAAQVKASVDKLNRSLKDVSNSASGYDMALDKLKGTVSSLAAGFAIEAVIGRMVAETKEAEFATAQLNAALKSTQGVAGQTIQTLQAHASALAQVSIYDDDVIAGAQALLLTFTKIQGDTFPKATQAVLNVATAMGTDLKSAAIQVGKALNDPILGVTALARSGIQFTDAQKAMIAEMVKVNNMLGAQKVILQELETQFGGSAKAARDTFGGALAALGNDIGNALTVTGDGVNLITKFVQYLSTVVKGLRQALDQAILLAEAVYVNVTGVFRILKAMENPSTYVATYQQITAEMTKSREAFLALYRSAKNSATMSDEAATYMAKLSSNTTTTAGAFGMFGTQLLNTNAAVRGFTVTQGDTVDDLLKLSKVTKLSAAEMATLRIEAETLRSALASGNVPMQVRLDMSTKLRDIQEALKITGVSYIAQLVQLAGTTTITTAEHAKLTAEATRLSGALAAGNLSMAKRVELAKQLQTVETALSNARVKLSMQKSAAKFKESAGTFGAPTGATRGFEVATVNPQSIRAKLSQSLIPAMSAAKLEYALFMEELRVSTAQGIGSALIDGFAAGFEAAFRTKSIGEGFKALGASLLQGLGSMMMQFGKAALLASSLMDTIFKALSKALPGGAIVASLAMIAAGAAMRGAASSAFGGSRGGGGGGIAGSFGVMSSMGGGGMTLPTMTYGPTTAGSASSVQATTPVNVTIIGPNDPAAQRQMQELVRNAQRRGSV